MKVGERLNILNGKGLSASATISTIAKKSLNIQISDVIVHTKKGIKFAVAFSLLKNKNDLLVVEKLTELGTDDLYPFIAKNTIAKGSGFLEKYTKTAITAIKQCDNPWLPNIHSVCRLEKMIDKIKSDGYFPVVAAETRPDKSLSQIISETSENICVIIGPEGGFDKLEYDYFEQENIPLLRLHDNVLRAETAAIVAATLAITPPRWRG
jgi:16S rRNA (uracil1498-N3)-methyltransferase